MSSSFNELWPSFPAYIPEFVGHQATHSVWERHLEQSPVHAMQPNWQALEAHETPESTVWGLQSITLHTAASDMGAEWQGQWPDVLPAGQATVTHSNACFGEPLLHAQNIALYQIKSPADLDWVAQCMFTERGKLQHVTFIRMHDWKPLAQKWDDVPALQNPPVQSPHAAPELIAAGAQAALSGWYEAMLPDGHVMQSYFANSDTRLIFREQGERFPTLGVTPQADEALVQWRWLSAK